MIKRVMSCQLGETCPFTWKPSQYLIAIFFILITLTFCQAGNGDLSEVEVDMTVEDYEHEQKLRCHQCYRSVHGEACVTLGDFSKVSVQECLPDEPFCMVERFMTDNEVTTFTRKCAQTCTSGCDSAGDHYKLEYCYSCCQDDFCNIGNAGSLYRPYILMHVLVATLLCLMTFL